MNIIQPCINCIVYPTCNNPCTSYSNFLIEHNDEFETISYFGNERVMHLNIKEDKVYYGPKTF